MHTSYKQYFTTALSLSTLAFLLHSTNVKAQTQISAQPSVTCAQYHLEKIPSIHMTHNKPWWFLSNDEAAVHANFETQTLPIMPADEHFLWSKDSRVLTQIKGALPELSTTVDKTFLIVRSRTIKPSPYRSAFGQYIETIGTAVFDSDGNGISVKDGMTMIPMLIRYATQEITQTDRLLPVACFERTIATDTPPPEANQSITEIATKTAPSQNAKISVLLNNAYVAERDAVALIDQGHLQGVKRGQVWQLVDTLPNQPASAKAFGLARILQVFDNSSLIRIEQTTHEATVGGILQHINKPKSNSMNNEPTMHSNIK